MMEEKKMFSNSFMNKVKEFVGTEIKYFISENEIKVYDDVEIQYKLKKLNGNYSLLIIERGKESKIVDFDSEVEARRKFPIYISGYLGEKIDYSSSQELNHTIDINKLKEFMYKSKNRNLFSINKIVTDNIILMNITDSLYDVFFVDRNLKKYYIEQNEKPPYIFGRFYNEVIYYSESLKRLDEYELVFNDVLDYEWRINFLFKRYL